MRFFSFFKVCTSIRPNVMQREGPAPTEQRARKLTYNCVPPAQYHCERSDYQSDSSGRFRPLSKSYTETGSQRPRTFACIWPSCT